MSRYNPPPYSPHYDFIAMRPMTIGGVDVSRGEAVDKSHFSEQRLRQMFDARMIAPAGFAEFPPPAYLENGRGKTAALEAERAREEAETAKLKGESHAQPRPQTKPAPPQRANTARTPPAPQPSPAKKVVKPKPGTAKHKPAPARKRA